MKKNIFIGFSATIFIFILFTFTAHAGNATDRIKAATDKLIAIVTNHDLDPPAMAEKRAHMIRETVDTVFDWGECSQRAMGRNWRKLSKEQKKEFIVLFGQLIERTYMDKTREYSDQKMNFIKEKTDEKYGVVDAEVELKNETNIPIQFRVIKKKGEWFIYDFRVKDFSLIANYRAQFDEIMANDSGFGDLVKRLKAKLDENNKP